jgi:hypothetical protein
MAKMTIPEGFEAGRKIGREIFSSLHAGHAAFF